MLNDLVLNDKKLRRLSNILLAPHLGAIQGVDQVGLYVQLSFMQMDSSCQDCADSGAIYRLQIALPDGTMIAGVSDDISWTTDKTDRLVAFSFRSVARFTEEEARDLLEREAIRLSDSSRASSRPAWTG